jgi:polar amino acid transport system substrate-binding protein
MVAMKSSSRQFFRPFFHCALLLLALAGCVRPPSNAFRVGMELAYPPFETIDEQGRPAGVSVDLSNAIGERLGRPVIIENTAFDGLIPALKTGRIDAIVSSMTATAERAESIDFSEPYVDTGLCLLAGKNSSLKSIADADRPGAHIAVKKGTTGHLWAAANLHQATILVLDKEAACVLEVVQGKADAFIYDQLSVFRHWQRYRDTTRALLEPFRRESWAVGIRKGDAELVRAVNAALSDFRATGGFDRLGDRWLKDEKQAFRAMHIAFLFK